MKNYTIKKYDIIVVGAGHAGCEAALASARMGKSTLILSTNLEAVAMMACNPSIGGTGKGHLVREIDALGGQMGINIDKSFIQSRMLNTAKGPAVHSLRAQADKTLYHQEMKKTLENQENLDLKQGEVVEVLVKNGRAYGIVLKTGACYESDAVILATGTFLAGKIFIGESSFVSGPNGLAAATELSDNLRKIGLELRRFKTGTPARALAKSFDFSKMQEQKGDEEIVPFSFMNDELSRNQVSCWLTYTNERTHKVIRDNFFRSALFGGQIEGVGPRYCPSIEDKVNRFADKERHQLFVEPEGLNTDEMYIQGMSSSMPEDVQIEFYKTIEGLENLEIVRPAYAIEYDCIDPLQLKLNLETRKIERLFCAGQFNGSSGYEEAAAQGLMAGINAVLALDGKAPFILDRSEAYIGVLIDDLITKGTNEPYRIMTSRAEYRLILRQDNADLRLTEKAYELGVVSEARYRKFIFMKELLEKQIEKLTQTIIYPKKEVNEFLEEKAHTKISEPIIAKDLLKRPEITLNLLGELEPNLLLSEKNKLNSYVKKQIEIQVKYEGYIKKQIAQISKFKKLEEKQIPESLDYSKLEGLRLEAAQKLKDIKPMSIGQASRISGISPADINVLLVHLEKMRRKG
ncbi:MAG: tRNA uridine-5-carboxymethylaminomethyl(34) synthesis enzyme MnmG [Candidatus Fimenecus sp.]